MKIQYFNGTGSGFKTLHERETWKFKKVKILKIKNEAGTIPI
jgi:hypothetical protein